MSTNTMRVLQIMKELKTLPPKERVNVLIQCCSFFLAYRKLKSIKYIFDKLKQEFSLPSSCDKEIWMLITMVGQAQRCGATGSQIPMKTSTYTSANKMHNLGLYVKRAREVILRAEECGYVEFYKGYKDFKNDVSIMSCVIFTEKLLDLLPLSVIKLFSKPINVDEMVVIKDDEGNTYTKLTRFKGVGVNKSMMLEYNNCLSQHDIRLGVTKCFTAYKQVFSLDLDGAGRIYSFGGFQTMRSEFRQYLTIDGEGVTEVDIKSNHIASMYLLEGIILDEDFDCYSINLEGFEYSDVRPLCKNGIMCMINCKSKHGSVKALKNIVDEEEGSSDSDLCKFYGKPLSFFKEVITKLQDKHHRLEFFNKGEVLWRKLQRLDSRVCEYVLSYFTRRDIPVLGWHDSWVIAKQYRGLLQEVIQDAWYSVYGTKDNCFTRVEY